MLDNLARRCGAELIGTFLLVLFGVGAVQVAVLTGALQGLWQVAVVWGVGIAVAIFAVGSISGAHLNPAITLALAAGGRFGWRGVLPYWSAQFAGSFLAAAVLYCLFSGFLTAAEARLEIRRGEPESVLTALCYGEYYPNLASLTAGTGPVDEEALAALRGRVVWWQAFVAELLGTAILALVIFAVTDPTNAGRPLANLAPPVIGLTVSALICVLGPLTQACFNPARDLAPRLFAACAGWGAVAWTCGSPAGWLTVYIVAPCCGAWLGGQAYIRWLQPPPESTPSIQERNG